MTGILSAADAFELDTLLTDLPTRPPRLTPETLRQMSPQARLQYNDERLQFIQSDFIVSTPGLGRCLTSITTIQERDHGRSFGRSAVLFDGPSGSGKTTTCLAVAAAAARRDPNRPYPAVIYVEVPPKATPKALLEAFLAKLRIEPPARATIGQLMQLVIGNTRDLGIEMVIIDELQHLAYKTRSVVEAVNTLKSLRNGIAAVFVYAGVDISVSALMSGSHGQQLGRRTVRKPLTPMSIATTDGRKEWRGVIRAFEREVGLLDHEVGTLMNDDRYMFDRTGGSIGSARNLIVDSAIALITAHSKALKSGADTLPKERIDRELLDQMDVDMGAEMLRSMAATA